MSRSEVDRFVQHLNSGEAILQDVSEGLVGLDSLIERANTHGYDFTSAEAKEYMREKHPKEVGHLNDEELEAVAGGQGSGVATAIVNIPATNIAMINPIVTSYDPVATTITLTTVAGVGSSDK